MNKHRSVKISNLGAGDVWLDFEYKKHTVASTREVTVVRALKRVKDFLDGKGEYKPNEEDIDKYLGVK